MARRIKASKIATWVAPYFMGERGNFNQGLFCSSKHLERKLYAVLYSTSKMASTSTVVFGIRIPNAVAEQLTTIAQAYGYQDRNAVVKEAIARFVREHELQTKNPAA